MSWAPNRAGAERLVADAVPLGGRRPLHAEVTMPGSAESGSAPLRAPGIRLPKPAGR